MPKPTSVYYYYEKLGKEPEFRKLHKGLDPETHRFGNSTTSNYLGLTRTGLFDHPPREINEKALQTHYYSSGTSSTESTSQGPGWNPEDGQ